MAIMVIIVNTAIIWLCVEVLEDIPKHISGAIEASASTLVPPLPLAGAGAVLMAICFILWCIVWIYCMLPSLCITKPPLKLPLVTFPDPSLLLSKLSSLGGIRLKPLQKPSVPGPMGAILNWAEGKISTAVTEGLDSMAGSLSDGNVVNMQSPNQKNIPVKGLAFAEALTRRDQEALDALIGGPNNVEKTVRKAVCKYLPEGTWDENMEKCVRALLHEYPIAKDTEDEKTELPTGCFEDANSAPIQIGATVFPAGGCVFNPAKMTNPFTRKERHADSPKSQDCNNSKPIVPYPPPEEEEEPEEVPEEVSTEQPEEEE